MISRHCHQPTAQCTHITIVTLRTAQCTNRKVYLIPITIHSKVFQVARASLKPFCLSIALVGHTILPNLAVVGRGAGFKCTAHNTDAPEPLHYHNAPPNGWQPPPSLPPNAGVHQHTNRHHYRAIYQWPATLYQKCHYQTLVVKSKTFMFGSLRSLRQPSKSQPFTASPPPKVHQSSSFHSYLILATTELCVCNLLLTALLVICQNLVESVLGGRAGRPQQQNVLPSSQVVGVGENCQVIGVDAGSQISCQLVVSMIIGTAPGFLLCPPQTMPRAASHKIKKYSPKKTEMRTF